MNPPILDSLAWAMVKAVAIVVSGFSILMYLAWIGTKGFSSGHRSRSAAGYVRRGAVVLVRTAMTFSFSNSDPSVSMRTLQRRPVEPNI